MSAPQRRRCRSPCTSTTLRIDGWRHIRNRRCQSRTCCTISDKRPDGRREAIQIGLVSQQNKHPERLSLLKKYIFEKKNMK
jgi:hypothetical protein